MKFIQNKNKSNMNNTIKNILLGLSLAIVTTGLNAQVTDDKLPATGVDSAYVYFDSDGRIYTRTVSTDLDSKAIEEIGFKVFDMINEFNDNVAKLWRPWTPEEKRIFTRAERLEYKTKIENTILNLFYAKGEKFTTTDSAEYLVKSENGYRYYVDQKKRRRNATGKNIYKGEYGEEHVKVLEDVEHDEATIEKTSKYKLKSDTLLVKDYLNGVKHNGDNDVYAKVIMNTGGLTLGKLVKKADGRYEGTITYYQEFTGVRPDGRTYSDRTYRTVRYTVERIVNDGLVYWDVKFGDIRATGTESLDKPVKK